VAGVRKLEAAHPDVQVFLYAAGHGFNCSERASYDAAAAAQACERTLGFLRRHVG
jgi:carboxymethylenebutenolidase